MKKEKIDFQIIDYQPVYKPRWKAINEAWITKSFWMEPIDHQHCDHPEASILAGGGQILLAKAGDEIIGTAGILKDNDTTFELIKMAVDENYRGMGVGKALCIASIERAKALGAKCFYLFSNTKGSAAGIELYRQLGFVETSLGSQEFERADIRMEMWFE